MSDNWTNIVQELVDNLLLVNNELIDYTGCDNDDSGFVLEHFWKKLGIAGKSVHHEVTKLCMSLSKAPLPPQQEVRTMLGSAEAAVLELVSVLRSLPHAHGRVLLQEVSKAVAQVLDNVIPILKSLKYNGTKASKKERLKYTACVWEACDRLEECSRDNAAATCKVLQWNEMLVCDALQELEEEVKMDRSGRSVLGEELDNSERWSNQDRELVGPCVGLVKTARACIRRLGRAARKQASCQGGSAHVAQLDQLAAAVKLLSPAVDDFVSSVYPPMNRELVKAGALSVVDKVQAVLQTARDGHFMTEEDQEWVSFLLKAVDHNNNRLQPLLSL